MRTAISCLIVSLSILAFIPEGYPRTLNMGFFELPPHFIGDKDLNTPSGAAIRYFETVAKKAGYTVKWSGMPLLRLTEYIRHGKLDGTVSFPRFPFFESFLHYCDVPMYWGQPIFVVSKESPLNSIRKIEDIKGFRIGVVHSKSNRYIPLIDENREKITLEELPNLEWVKLNLVKLVNGRLDAFFDRQQYAIPYVAKSIQLQDKIKIINAPEPAAPFFIVFSKAVTDSPAIIQKINHVLSMEYINYEQLLDEEFARLE